MNQPHISIYAKFLETLKRREGLLRILMFTLVTVFCWIGFSIFLSQKRTKVPNDVQKYTIPLNPNIDRLTLSEIERRRSYSDQELQDFPIFRILSDENGSRIQSQIGQDTIVFESSQAANFSPTDIQSNDSELSASQTATISN
jgi:hypothetical protein